MTNLDDARWWFETNRRLLRMVGRLGRQYWAELPWGGKLGHDDQFRLVDGGQLDRDSRAVLEEFDDLGIFVFFSVFEAGLRAHLKQSLFAEVSELKHTALKRAADELLRNVEEGGFYNHVLALYKDLNPDRVEGVNQVRKYRNWVAHGRKGEKPFGLSPIAAYERLKAFQSLLGYDTSSSEGPDRIPPAPG